MTFEGVDGAGKTTLIQGLQRRLQTENLPTWTTREPGSGPVGAKIRELLLGSESLCAEAELFLFLADRAQHIETLVRPALAAGQVVLCDRHADSTLVYQGYGRGLSLEKLREWNLLATRGLVPDLTFLLHLPIEVAEARQTKGDRLDAESREFRIRVIEGFLEEAKRAPERWVVLDAILPPEALVEAAWETLSRRLVQLT